MEWKQLSETHWTADSEPDWYASSLEEAKRICEEADARPPVPPEGWIVETPSDYDWMDRPEPEYDEPDPDDEKKPGP